MSFYPIKNPPNWLLDGLLSECPKRSCPDCGVKLTEHHLEGCDVARCQNTGGQRLICYCGKCGEDSWTGVWPGVMMAFEKKTCCF